MSNSDKLLLHPPKAFLTDVFGTVVNWRKTTVKYLEKRAHEALASATASIPSVARSAAARVSWPEFAQEWRASYYRFTRGYNPDTMPFRSIDEHCLLSLQQLMQEHGIEGLWNADEVAEISLIWHNLEPWPDSAPGLKQLQKKFITATLSNGNQTLLADLASHGDLAYTKIISAEDFKAYKPNPKVYLGAADSLELAASDCCLIAAHLGDLKAAKACGYQTVYIERLQEEEWSLEQIQEAKKDDFVDMWIKIDEGGFEAVAKKFDS